MGAAAASSRGQPPRPVGPAGRRAHLRGLLLAALWAVVVLAGCASVPSSGPIHAGPVLDAGAETQFIRVIAAPPSVGADPLEVAAGFLDAAASLEDDHAIARQYLTPEAAAVWRAEAGTRVYDPDRVRLARGSTDGSVWMSLSAVGDLTADGSLTHRDPAVPIEETIHLVRTQIDGQEEWRISDPPPGVLISATDLNRAYRLYQVYFSSPRSPALVPDPRMIPVVGPSLPTTLAERVLAGPGARLAPGLMDPSGISLATGSVPVSSGVALVELDDSALALDEAVRADLAAQLTWTLTQLPEVSSVRLQVGGAPLALPGGAAIMDRRTWARRDPDVLSLRDPGQVQPYFVLHDEAITRVSPGGQAVFDISVPGAGDVAGLAVSLDLRFAAARAADARSIWLLPLMSGVSPTRLGATRISSAGFDTDGRLWFVDDGRIRRAGLDGVVQDVPVQGDLPGPIVRLGLARDGTRVALTSQGRLFLGTIAPSPDGVVVTGLTRSETLVSQVSGLAWHDSVTLDALGVHGGSATQVLRITVGSGQVLPLGAPSGPEGLAAAPEVPTLAATVEESLFSNVGLQWRPAGLPARAVAYPG